MPHYRYQEFAYLIVPALLGIEFFLSSRDEKKDKEVTPVGSYVLELFGFLFSVLIPALFFFTIFSIELKVFPLQTNTLAGLDRYGVMFFFFGAWWQVYIFGALKARRLRLKDGSKWELWIPFLFQGIFISFLILWVSPWNLRWVSAIWFLIIFAACIKISMKIIERIFWILAGIVFLIENILFIWLESVV